MKFKQENVVRNQGYTSDWQEFLFDKESRYFFVKNYSDYDIFVSFKNGTNEDNCFKIKSGVGEEVAITYVNYDAPSFWTNKIYVKGTGEVEVQALDIWEE